MVEFRLPYAELANVVPEEKAKLLTGKAARPWVRIECQTWDGRERRVVDYGPCVASFRLSRRLSVGGNSVADSIGNGVASYKQNGQRIGNGVASYKLDEDLPERPQPPVAIDLPTRGTWYVMQGAHGSFSHKDTWACDLTRVDNTGNPARPPDSPKVEDYLAYNEPVYAPMVGRVLRVRSDVDDSAPHGDLRPGVAVNQVFLGGTDYSVDLCHFKRDGVLVQRGEAVEAGQRVGFVGNSGVSDVPHVHVAVWNRWRTVPLAFRHVRVGLNDAPDDPWARDLDAWEPRKGYFVAPRKTP